MPRHLALGLLFALTIAAFSFPANLRSASRPLGLVLPTDNTASFSSEPWKFYMYTNRNFEGVASTPWEGGQYGFSRELKRTAAGLINTKFHEGIDIRPVRRTSDGTPLDVVRSIAAGSVVYTNDTSSHSSYGKYVVVKHDWGDGEFYSLYAHLMSISARTGQRVGPGTELGRLGYTGVGIDKTRSHVHLELNLLLSSRFQQWHDLHHRTPNHHGIYNGLIRAGIDIAGLHLAHRGNSEISVSQFLKRMEVYYKVLVPNRGTLELTKRYPWLGSAGSSASLEISLSRSGVPLAVDSSSKPVGTPVVSWVKSSPTYHSYNTRGLLTGSGSSAGLSQEGVAYIRLLSGEF